MKFQIFAGVFAANVHLFGDRFIMHTRKKLTSYIVCSLLAPTSAVTTEIIDAAPEEVELSPEYCPTCTKVDRICYNRSYLFDLTAPFRQHVVIKKMGLLRSTNVLYYSFEPTLDDPEYFKVAYVSIDGTAPSGVLNGTKTFNFSVFDINQSENKIYLGGSDGIWYIENANEALPRLKYFVSQGDTITNVIVKDYVYFTKKNFPGIIKNKNGQFEFPLENKTIDDFVLDKDVEYTVVYLHHSGLYAFNSRTKEDVRLSKNRFFRGLTVDLEGVVYAWYLDGIYKVSLDPVFARSNVRRVSDVVVGAMAFDNLNNILYTTGKSLYRLTKTGTTKC